MAPDPALGWVRLLVRLPEPPDDDGSGERDLRERVDHQLGDVDGRGAPWVLEPLFGTADVADLRRWWTVGGAVPSLPAYDHSRVAYDLAGMLARDPDLHVDPDLPASAFGADGTTPPVTTQALPEAVATGDGAHLPAAADRMWALEAVRARAAWELPPAPGGRSRGEGVLIGHIDTGYSDHPELERAALNLDLDRDVLDGDDDARDPLRRRFLMPLDSPGHGTHTGSVIAGRLQGRIAGAAPQATLVPIRAIRSVVQVLDGDVARAVDVARARGCHIISMSLGGRGFVGLRDAIRAAVADGLIVMAAAGNKVGFVGLRDAIRAAVADGLIVMAAAGNKVGFVVAPASYPECIAVAATNAESRPWAGSSRGALVDISAPGESVWAATVDVTTTPPTFDRRQHHGTSFAVATLAGVAALWLAHWGPERIRERYGVAGVQRAFLALLRAHGHRRPAGWRENGWDRAFGVGIVDALALLEAGLPDLPETAPAPLPAAAQQPDRRLWAALGELTPDQVRTAVGDLLGIDDADVEALPPVVVSELLYRLGEDDQLRAALLAQAAGAGPESAPAADARMLLARTSSLALRATLLP